MFHRVDSLLSMGTFSTYQTVKKVNRGDLECKMAIEIQKQHTNSFHYVSNKALVDTRLLLLKLQCGFFLVFERLWFQ